MLTKLIPLLYILAMNPVKSPVIPPPIPMIKSVRFKFFANNLSKKKFTVFNDFFFLIWIKNQTC